MTCSIFTFVNLVMTVTNGEPTVTNGDKKEMIGTLILWQYLCFLKYELHEFNTDSIFSYSYFTNVIIPLLIKLFF